MARHWQGTEPKNCDMCNEPITKIFIDGATQTGGWAILCEGCHRENGCGLGLGRGQKYELKDGVWEKTAG